MSVLRSGIAITPLLVSGCNGVLWGNLGVLCVTVAIFLGTVFLGRTRPQQPQTRQSQRPSASASFGSRAEEPRASTSHHS